MRQQQLDFEQKRDVVALAAPSIKVLTAPSGITESVEWTVSSIRSALNSHELGDFTESARLAQSLDRDERIAPCIADRVNALVGAGAADFSIEPEEMHVRRSKAVISRLDWWHRTVSSQWLASVLRDGIKLGVHLSRVPWLRTNRAWIPQRPVRWNPEHFYWSEQDGYYVATTTQGQFPVLPGDPNWFLYEPGGQHSWLSGAIRGLGIPYMMRTWDYRDWARYNERHGLPIIEIKEPSGAGKPGEKAGFYQAVKRMGASGFLRSPQGVDEHSSYGMKLHEASARSFDSFDKFIDRLNTAIAIYLKGQNLTTEVQAGAYASTGWHMRVRKDYAENDADAVSEALREQLIVPFGQYNIGSWDDEIAPWPTWDLEIPEDQAQVATALKDGTEAIGSLLDRRIPVDWDDLLPRLGIKLEKGAKMPVPDEPEESKPTERPQDDGAQGNSPPPQNLSGGRSRFHAVAADGFTEGQLYVDALTENTARDAEALLAPTIEAVLEELDAAVDYDDLRERLRARYEGLSPEGLSELAHRAMTLSNLAGRKAALQDQ